MSTSMDECRSGCGCGSPLDENTGRCVECGADSRPSVEEYWNWRQIRKRLDRVAHVYGESEMAQLDAFASDVADAIETLAAENAALKARDEEIALMEAVVKACGMTLGEVGNTTNWIRAIAQARDALAAYRKERGYR